MVTLEYFDGEKWAFVGTYPNAKVAWVALGSDNHNYRTIDEGTILTAEIANNKTLNNHYDRIKSIQIHKK